MPHFSHPLRCGRLLCLGLAWMVWPAVSPAQDKSAADTPEAMKPYTETLPGIHLKFDMVPIPGGTFTIGSPESEPDRRKNEGPQRQVTIAPFWMGKHEVTWELFDEFAFNLDVKRKERLAKNLNNQPESEKRADAVSRPTAPYADMTFGMGHDGQPAICMTHHAAMEYCRWLSEKTGKDYRLPTEAEWEYACRAGTKTAYWFGDDPDELEEHEWFVNNAETPQKVGTMKPNPWGLYDMSGNVSEWCLDHYIPDIYAQYPADKPVIGPVALPDDQEYSYVARGGSWDYDADQCRSAYRSFSDREWSMQDPQRPQSIWWHTDARFVGIRVVRPFQEQDNLVGLKSKVVSKKGTR